MSALYWLCQECGDQNDFSKTKVCRVCGNPIDKETEYRCIYETADNLCLDAVTAENFRAAAAEFDKIGKYKDAEKRSALCMQRASALIKAEELRRQGAQYLDRAAASEREKDWPAAEACYRLAEKAFSEIITLYSEAKLQDNTTLILTDQQVEKSRWGAKYASTNVTYCRACDILKQATDIEAYKAAAELFKEIPSFSDAKKLYSDCLRRAEELRVEQLYNDAVKLLEKAKATEDKKKTLAIYTQILDDYQQEADKSNYSEFKELIQLCKQVASDIRAALQREAAYNKALQLLQNATAEEEYRKAADAFAALADYKEAKQKREDCIQQAGECKRKRMLALADEELLLANKVRLFDWLRKSKR